MNHQAQTDTASIARRFATAALAGAVLAVLGACSSDNSGGTDVTIGSGQNADPVTLDFPVFYVKRPVPDPEDDDVMENDARRLLRFEVGADLFMRDRASPSAPEVNITANETRGLGDIRDVDVNFDGTKVLFSMRARFIANADEEDQPTWNIWEYNVTNKVLRRVITSDTIEEEGHDIMPHYLPDGRIVFSSTRQRQARGILLDENRPQYAAQDEDNREPAFVLHVMDEDGQNINQISFNQSHDLDPTILNNGQIVFTRWEHAIDDNQMDLYSVNPDGTNLRLLYGPNSHNTGTVDPATGMPSVIQFLTPRAMIDNRTLVITRPFVGTNEGGDLVLIDTANFADNNQPTETNAGLRGPAQTRALPTEVRTNPGAISPGGRFRTAAPLYDGTNRLMVSWSQCRLLLNTRIVPCTPDNLAEPDVVEAPPLYGIYLFDVRDNTQRPIVAPQEGFIYTEVVAAASRQLPPVILDRVADVDYPKSLDEEAVGIMHIRSVYDFDGVDTAPGGIGTVRNPGNAGYATRPARFLRIEKVISQPDRDTRQVPNTNFGPMGRRFGMREILGYAPVEPDGSVKVKVPANVAFTISTLDANGRRIGGRHTNWLQVKPGEAMECNGCHIDNASNRRAHGRPGLFNSINAGATNVAPFPNTNPGLLPTTIGETMAEVRGRITCGGACEPSVDLISADYWSTTPPATAGQCYSTGRSNVPSGILPVDPTNPATFHTCLEANGETLRTPAPVRTDCHNDWTSRCRTAIHYETHIHPLWGVMRDIPDPMDPAVVLERRTCNTCHSLTNPVDATVQVPQGQLDLSDGASDMEADQFKSYRELLFTDNLEILDNGQVIEFLDPDTLENQPVAPSMSGGGANASRRFFEMFDSGGGGTVDHRGFLTPAELRLIAEWLDIGAQYYNDPFLPPEN